MAVWREERRATAVVAALTLIREQMTRAPAVVAAVTVGLAGLVATRGIPILVREGKVVPYFPQRLIASRWVAEGERDPATTPREIIKPAPAAPAAASLLFVREV